MKNKLFIGFFFPELNNLSMEFSDFRLLFESAPGLYLILSPDLKIVAVSDSYLNATMTKREEITGRKLFDVFPDNPDDPDADGVSNLRASLTKVIANCREDSMAVQKYDIRRTDGTFEERFWSPLNKPVLNSKNEVIYIIHRAEDVTEFVLLKKEQENKNRFAEILQDRVEKTEAEIFLRAREIQKINTELEMKISESKKTEELLTRSNKLLSDFFDLNPASIVISRLSDAKLINVNKSFLSSRNKSASIKSTSLEIGAKLVLSALDIDSKTSE
ncbi:MAG: PAS domain-containing protein, partial [Bacteroidia bacterium]|nr:PAS domain-containing protein [Bacteroidia bacterium]